jgi:glycosyltransferase involved in cell wall biosynthesis
VKVSIVTISFNQAAFLERAMRSVVDQDYPNVEYIVVDPGSTDGSRELIDLYNPRIARTIFDPDNGAADGLNRGFAVATGEKFGYLNADDAFLPGAISQAVEAFERNDGIDVVCGHGYKIDPDDRVIRRVYSEPFSLRRRRFGASTIVQQSTFFKREAFVEVGGFNIENRTCWDGELMLDFGLAGKSFHLTDACWSAFRIHPGGISGSGRLAEQYQKDEARLFRKAYGRERKLYDIAGAVLYRIAKHAAHPARLIQNLTLRPSGKLAI